MKSNYLIRHKLLVLLAIAGVLLAPHNVWAAEETPTPEPMPTIPPAYTEPIQTNAVENWPEGPAVYAESAIVMDADTGTILYGKNIDDQKYPASITKIMTTLLAVEHAHPSERVIFSEHAIWGIERDSSHIGIRIGENLSMEDCLYGMMLASANEVCIAVAEHIAGTVDAYVTLMNEKAAALGCTNTNFANVNGLPSEEHFTTAHDMALIARAAYENERFRSICSTTLTKIGWTNKTGEDRWLLNHHKMMLDDTEFYYEGCQGGKTGYTDTALNTLVTYAGRADLNLICVTMRTAGRQVYTDTAALLDYGFANFHKISVSGQKKQLLNVTGLLFPGFCRSGNIRRIRSEIQKDTHVTAPSDVSFNDLTMAVTTDSYIIKRSYIYNGYPLGDDTVSHPPEISRLSTAPANKR